MSKPILHLAALPAAPVHDLTFSTLVFSCRETSDTASADEPAHDRALVPAGTARASGYGTRDNNDDNSSARGRPLIVIQLPCGQQLRIDSWQTALRLYARASVQCSPAQLRALRSAAEQCLRHQPGAVSVRMSHSNIININTNDSNVGVSTRVVGALIAGVSGTAAPTGAMTTGAMTTSSRTFSMIPRSLPSLGPACGTGGGDGRMIACYGGLPPGMLPSVNNDFTIGRSEQRFGQQDQRQLSCVSVSADTNFIVQLFDCRAMWRYPCGLPCQLFALRITEASIVVRPATFLIPTMIGSGSRRISRGRTIGRQPYTVSRSGRRQWPHFRSRSPVRSRRAATSRILPPRQESRVALAAQGGDINSGRTSKVFVCVVLSIPRRWLFLKAGQVAFY